MINWLKVMEFCDQSWKFINVAPEFCEMCTFFFPDIEKFSIMLIISESAFLVKKCPLIVL